MRKIVLLFILVAGFSPVLQAKAEEGGGGGRYRVDIETENNR